GEYSFKLTTVTYSEGPGGLIAQTNWQGTVSDFGTVFSTVTFTGSAKGGTYRLCERAILDDGTMLSAIGHGTYEGAGGKRRSIRGIVEGLDDGRRFRIDGEIDMSAQTWKGTYSELS